jgi:SAM-dependent methyltransferase
MPHSKPKRLADDPAYALGGPLQAESLGLGLSPGDHHYRAYVGPPQDYDLIAAISFNLLTTLGLRQHHSVLDIGCGSLRIGRLLIPYLNAGKYCGLEPNRWLVEDGLHYEVGLDLMRIKQPRFYYDAHARCLPELDRFDFAIAQSIFSHCGVDLIRMWLTEASKRLEGNGMLLATYLPSTEASPVRGWVYPQCTAHPNETMEELADSVGLRIHRLTWPHPRQQWALFARAGVAPDLLRPILADKQGACLTPGACSLRPHTLKRRSRLTEQE